MDQLKIPVVGIFILCLWSANSIAAGVYRCVDDAGNVSFQQTACSFDLEQDQIDLKFERLRQLAGSGNDQGFTRHVLKNQLAGFQDSSGASPLHIACTSPTTGACRWLVTQGEFLEHQDQRGRNALHHAASAGSVANVGYLLKAGIEVESLDKSGASALYYAVRFGHLEVAMFLLENGSDPNEADLEGMTPLKLAVVNSDQEAARLLIRFDADPDQKDAGTTAVDIALEYERNDMLSTLNPAMRRVLKWGNEISLPTPVDGWNCGTFSRLLAPEVKVLLRQHLDATGCYLRVSSLEQLSGNTLNGDVEVFSMDWLGSIDSSSNARQAFELTVERYRRASRDLFVEDDQHIGTLQSAPPMGVGDQAIVTTCAEIITILSERLVVVRFCHLGHSVADERLLLGVKASAARWYDRLIALNP